ncbi:hypothetical protein [Jongsikchunia kroppenstedtii]|nr:hypothetical protein [Jongsikchunia kroppenstedtii]
MIWIATFLIIAGVSCIGLGIASYTPEPEPIEIDRGRWVDE